MVGRRRVHAHGRAPAGRARSGDRGDGGHAERGRGPGGAGHHGGRRIGAHPAAAPGRRGPARQGAAPAGGRPGERGLRPGDPGCVGRDLPGLVAGRRRPGQGRPERRGTAVGGLSLCHGPGHAGGHDGGLRSGVGPRDPHPQRRGPRAAGQGGHGRLRQDGHPDRAVRHGDRGDGGRRHHQGRGDGTGGRRGGGERPPHRLRHPGRRHAGRSGRGRHRAPRCRSGGRGGRPPGPGGASGRIRTAAGTGHRHRRL